MQLHEIDTSKDCIEWHHEEHDVCSHDLVFEDKQHMVDLIQPYPVVNMQKYSQLNELNYREIATGIDGNFLNQKVRADALNGIQLAGIDDGTLNFMINSSEFSDNRIKYKVDVMFDQWDELGQDPDLTFQERSRMLLWVGDIKLHCTCPSFLYWGYQYILTVLDASIYPEERYPQIRNPGERGIVCKHLNRILRVLPFYSGEMSRELKKQFGN